MYNSTITSEHRSKLVQMTSFVMYEFEVSMSGDTVTLLHKTDVRKHITTHWLEQVMFHLAKKIIEKEDSAIMMFLTTCCLKVPTDDSNHPINYLYERYIRNREQHLKQLKLNLNVE
jgi:hypothetical protein